MSGRREWAGRREMREGREGREREEGMGGVREKKRSGKKSVGEERERREGR